MKKSFFFSVMNGKKNSSNVAQTRKVSNDPNAMSRIFGAAKDSHRVLIVKQQKMINDLIAKLSDLKK
jgi:hypothetical protein